MKKKYRTIFISDIHLGAAGCKAEYLLKFLDEYEADTYFLVGDFIDGWRIKSKFFWPESHSKIIKKILDLSTEGKKIIWILGNHDEFLRPYLEYQLSFGTIEVKNEDVHITKSGLKLWIIHGDKFDFVVSNMRWLCYLGDKGYIVLLVVNNYFNKFRNLLGFKYWSLSNYIKLSTKRIMQFMSEYAKAISIECKEKGYDGVVCGHIHHAEYSIIHDIHYYNTGDWVESCTAILEDENGGLELIKFVEINH